MTRINIVKDKNGNIRAFTAKGHSGYKEHGEDIVCAVVSTITQAVIIGISEVLKVKGFSFTVKDGYLHWEINEAPKDSVKDKIDCLTKTMEIVLKQAEEQYGGYLSVSEKSE